jgi:hypothetical protein|tara:strand:- start:785 stop:3955 length:3171 start_codon:yes stop_codon:yes gene_type:complete
VANGTDLRDFYYGTPDASSSPVAPPNKGPALYEGAKGAAGGLQNVFGNVLSSGVDLLFNTVEKAGAAAVKTLLTTFTELNRPYSMISGGLESLWDPSSGFIAGLGEGWRTADKGSYDFLFKHLDDQMFLDPWEQATGVKLTPEKAETRRKVFSFLLDVLNPAEPTEGLGLLARKYGRPAIETIQKDVFNKLGESPGGQILLDQITTRKPVPRESGITDPISVNVTAAEQRRAVESPPYLHSRVTEEGKEAIETMDRRLLQVEDVPESLRDPVDRFNADLMRRQARANFRMNRVAEMMPDMKREMESLLNNYPQLTESIIIDVIEEYPRRFLDSTQERLIERHGPMMWDFYIDMPPDLRHFVNRVRNQLETMLYNESQAGLSVKRLSSKASSSDQIGYFPHILDDDFKKKLGLPEELPDLLLSDTKDVVDWLQLNIPDARISDLAIENWTQVQRHFQGTAHEINIMISNGVDMVDSKGRPFILQADRAIVNDPLEALYKRKLVSESGITDAEFMDSMVRHFSLSWEDAPESWKLDQIVGGGDLSSLSQFGNITKDVYFDPDIAEAIVNIVQKIRPWSKTDARVLLDKAFNTRFKIGALAYSPSYHSRNVISNVYISYLNDVQGGSYLDAARIMSLRTGNSMVDGILADGKWIRLDEIAQQADEWNITGSGFYGADLGVVLENQKWWTPSTHLFKIQEFYEDYTRMAMFVDRIKRGDTYEEAALFTWHRLYNYTDLTDFDRQAKGMILFWTWLRKNIPRAFEYLIYEPRKALVPQRFGNVMEKGLAPEIPSEEQQDFIRDDQSARISEDERIRFVRTFPLHDLQELAEPAQFFVDSMHPLIGGLVSVARGVGFGGRPLTGNISPRSSIPLSDYEKALVGSFVPGGAAIFSLENVLAETRGSMERPGSPGRAGLAASGLRIYSSDPTLKLQMGVNEKEEEMWRIMYNIAQLLVNGREGSANRRINDLREVFISALELGEAGRVVIDDLSTKGYVPHGKRFADAWRAQSDEMENTMDAIRNMLRDAKDMIGSGGNPFRPQTRQEAILPQTTPQLLDSFNR